MSAVVDGDWHRLHPATPLLRGGIFIVAILGFVIANLRERLIDFFFGVPGYEGDPIDEIIRRGIIGWVLLGIAVVLIVILIVFYLSWRMHTFRITDEVVEVRSGLLFRSHRKARLDRIQGVNIVRPLIPRMVGAARLEVSVAGQDANVSLAYLRSALADDLRREILRLASGARQSALGAQPVAVGEPTEAGTAAAVASGARASDLGGRIGGFASDRLNDFITPELDPNAAPPESVVRIPPLRLLGSLVFSPFTVFLVVAAIAIIVSVSAGTSGWLLIVLVPGIIASVTFYFSRFTKSLQYSIAGTPDGVRVGFGLLSTSSEILPPGRIHAIEVSQPILWRPFGWWQVRINTAGHSTTSGAAGQANTTTLPVGNAADVAKVLELILPGYDGDEQRWLIWLGMTGSGSNGGFTNAPRRAAWLRPFSWRRTGYAINQGVVIIRRGIVSRELILVPLARLQSVRVDQGPIERMLRLASAHVHTVAGPVSARLPAVDVAEAERFFGLVSAGAVESAYSDTSHRWNRGADAAAPTAEAAPTAHEQHALTHDTTD